MLSKLSVATNHFRNQPNHPFFALRHMVKSFIKVFTDASLRYGAWINSNGRHKTFAIPPAFQYSSYASEFYAAQQAIKDTAPLSNHMHLYCDNQGVYLALRNHRIGHPANHPQINHLLNSVLSFIDKNNIHLSVLHIPSDLNPADPLSHHPPNNVNLAQADSLLNSVTQ
ncbi:hypothetical protein BKA57DRAFT_236768 [Linnemannia elongata]|nr:hypothetical protein BKA57DRAFT_236768 [Linnemannia elongata]